MRQSFHKVIKSLKQLRNASTKTSPFFDTVLLPKTDFQAKVTAKVVAREITIQEKCGFDDLYQWQSTNNQGKDFILHDGPPYANGDVHVGHALNKILKDITNRYKMMRGYRVHYIPGWDCHGLPVEMKAIKSKQGQHHDPMTIRTAARDFATKTIEKQRDAFKRWGVMADWSDEKCYFTYAKNFEAKELEAFYEIFKKGFVYRDLKPVYWSPSSQTALAEAELEYNSAHRSRSVYFSFPLKGSLDVLKDIHPESFGSDINIMAWTTQPWTIPANKAVCYAPNELYYLGKAESDGRLYIFAKKRYENIQSTLDKKFQILTAFEGKLLEGKKCHHPMDHERLTILLPSSHVEMDKGTGFVHTAPAHGTEDFALAVQHGLETRSEVDGAGMFTEDAGYNLAGKFIFTDGNSSVIAKISENNDLIFEHDYIHSYPYDWRTKEPIFVRTSRQWFVDIESLKHTASALLEGVKIIPNSGRATMMSHLKGRTFWCISRQRSWGLPIPVFYHKHKGETLLSENNEMLLTDASVKHIISVVKKHGSNAWWELPMHDLLPQSVLKESGFKDSSPDDFETGKDILDIWFDSGLTWAAVLGKDCGSRSFNAPVADLYLEGKDQYGGWFQSSLLTSCAIREKAPYKNLLVHGFVMSESGQKMSKSLGNVVDPLVVTEGGKHSNEDPPYGSDVLRLWVAESNTHQEIAIGKNKLDAVRDSLNKIRLCFRFLLGNLNDYEPDKHLLPLTQMWSVDRYVLATLHNYSKEVTEAYDQYDYAKVTRLLLHFMTRISNFYFATIKDRLYCDEKHGTARLSCQTTLHHLLKILVKSAAPILPHTMEEVMLLHPCPTAKSVFKDGWCDTTKEWDDEKLCDDFNHLLKIRDVFVSALEGRQQSLADLEIKASGGSMLNLLKSLQSTDHFSELRELFGCSSLTLTTTDSDEKQPSLLYNDPDFGFCALKVKNVALHKCQRCRLYTAEKPTNPCDRCANVIAAPWAR